MTRICIYARVSTDRQENENQLAQMRRFAELLQWEVIREYVDHETGKHADRLQFRRLFEDASRREFDVVLFWALDRFTREGPLETLQHLNLLSAYGAGLERARRNGTKTGRPIGRPRVIFRRDQVAELHAQRLSWAQIARKVSASVRTVRRVVQIPT